MKKKLEQEITEAIKTHLANVGVICDARAQGIADHFGVTPRIIFNIVRKVARTSWQNKIAERAKYLEDDSLPAPKSRFLVFCPESEVLWNVWTDGDPLLIGRVMTVDGLRIFVAGEINIPSGGSIVDAEQNSFDDYHNGEHKRCACL